MTPLRETIDTLAFKYNIRREYFTIVLPVLLGLAIVILAFMSGHTLTQSQAQPDNSRQQALQLLMSQMNDSEGQPVPIPQAPQNKADLDQYIIYGLLVAMTPYSIDRFIERRRYSQREDDFTQFLFKLSEMMRAGIDPIKSVLELSKTDLGSITPYVRSAASSMLLGKSFEEGMKSMALSLNSEIIIKYVDLVIQASYTGGSVHSLILKASEDMRTMITIDKEMKGNLQQYVMILYLAQAIIIFIAYVLSSQLIPFIQSTANAQAIFSTADLQSIDFGQGFFHMIMINAAIGGLIVGKIAEGSAKDGIKHSVILMAAGYLICVLLILPIGNQAQANLIIVMSGNSQSGYTTMQLYDPIVFKLTDPNGIVLANQDVSFSIKPGGIVTPASEKTDIKGLAKVNVTMGNSPGSYTITATSGSVTQTVKITARGGARPDQIQE